MANAYAAFQEKDKGSLEVGKYADIVILSNNLMTCKDEEIKNTKVVTTIVGGKVKYKGQFWYYLPIALTTIKLTLRRTLVLQQFYSAFRPPTIDHSYLL